MCPQAQHQLEDPARLRALAACGLLDSEPEAAFDRLTRSAAQLTHCSTALISLLDGHREFFKSTYGFAGPFALQRQCPLSHSLCQHVVKANRVFVVECAPSDPLVADNPALSELGVGAYMGAPIHLEHEPIGAVSVMSPEPRAWSPDEIGILENLALTVETEIALRVAKRELLSRTMQLCTLTDSTLDAIISVDADGNIYFANAAAARIFHCHHAQLLGRSVTELMPQRFRDAHMRGIARMNAGAAPSLSGRIVELAGLRDDHEEFPIELTLSQWRNGGAICYTAIIRDITERSRMDQALRDTEEQLRLMVDRSPIGIALVSPEGRWLRVNDAICKIVGYTREQLLQKDFQSITHPEDLPSDMVLARQLLDGEVASGQLEKRYIHRDGQAVWIQLVVTLVRCERGKPLYFVAQVQDISERRQLAEQLREASLQDELTGLQNRRGFTVLGNQALSVAARSGRDLVLLYADLNGLKQVNDELGHEAGDRMIAAMAEILRSTFRRADIIARLGGDEFVVLAEGNASFGELAVTKLQRAIELHNVRDGCPRPLSASIGVITCPPGDQTTLAELLTAADSRMYAEKRKHKSSDRAARRVDNL